VTLPSLLAVNILPEVLKLGRAVVRDHSSITWLPSGWAHLSVLVGKRESLHKAQNLVSASSDGEVVNAVLAELSLFVDDVGCAVSGTLFVAAVFNQASVVTGNALVHVGEERNIHLANTTLIAAEQRPTLVDERGVAGAADDLSVGSLKLLKFVIKLGHLSWANKGEIEGPEEEHHVFACTSIS